MSTITTSRSRASLALATALALLAASFAIFVSPASATPARKIQICHATSSQSNPYTRNVVDMSSVDEQNNPTLNGHGDHTGPVFPLMDSRGNWGDIIPPFTYGSVTYLGYNWSAEGQAIYKNKCNVPEEATVIEFDLSYSPCAAGDSGNYRKLTVTNDAASTEEIDFTLEGPDTATRSGSDLAPGNSDSFEIPESQFGEWVLKVVGSEDTDLVNLTGEGCPADVVPPVTPQAPTFVEPTCTALDGAAVTVPKDTKSITYTQTGTPAPGAKVTVKATANEGYTIVEGATTEWVHTYKTVAELNCPPPAAVTPPTFTDATCAAPASMVIPTTTGQIAYTAVGTATPGTTVTVTAKPIGNVVLTGYPTGGWSFGFAAAPTNCDSAVGGTEDTDTPADDESDSADDEQVVASSEDVLAETGGNAGPAGLGLLLILSGAAFVTARRLALK